MVSWAPGDRLIPGVNNKLLWISREKGDDCLPRQIGLSQPEEDLELSAVHAFRAS